MYDITTAADSINCIMGYWSSSDPSAVELSDLLIQSPNLMDQYGNPAWQLGVDGITVIPANITPTDDQVAAYNLKHSPTFAQQKAASIQANIGTILQQLLSGPTPTDPWVIALLAALNNA